jgi:hypothetical protein
MADSKTCDQCGKVATKAEAETTWASVWLNFHQVDSRESSGDYDLCSAECLRAFAGRVADADRRNAG